MQCYSRGYSTVFLILMMAVLMIFSSSTIFLISTRTKKDVRMRVIYSARAVAEAAIDRTIWKMKGNIANCPSGAIAYNDFSDGSANVMVENLGSKIRINACGISRGEKRKIEVIVVNLMPNELQNAITSFSSVKLLPGKIKWGHLYSSGDVFFDGDMAEAITNDIQVYSSGRGYFSDNKKLNPDDYRRFTNLHFGGDFEDSFDILSDFPGRHSLFYDALNWNVLKEKARKSGSYFRGTIPRDLFLALNQEEKIIFVDTIDGKEFSQNNFSNRASVVIDEPVFQRGCLIVLGDLKFKGSGSGKVYAENYQTGEHRFLEGVFFSGFIHCAGRFSSDGNGKFFGSIFASSFENGQLPEVWYDTGLKYQPIPCFSEVAAIDSWREINTEQTQK
ncbi:MAG: hypothetical protein HY919_00340 [Elusimicrobia bacterium]|nr:hypothetical protein [Elusimicrobiota bacterium]